MSPTFALLAGSAFILAGFVALHAKEPERQEPLRLAPELRERCLTILREGIESNEFWPAMHAAEALTVAGRGEEVVAALRDRLPQERDDQRRCGLARELVRAGDGAALSVLFEILGDSESTGRVHAAESLYKLGKPGDGKLLEAAFQQQTDPQLQLMAAATLAKAGHAKALTLLRQRLKSDEPAVRDAAVWVLARLGDQRDVKPLLSLLERETNVASRAGLVNALACLGHPRGYEELGQNLDSTEPGVRTMAAEFVGHSRSVEHQAKLVRLLDDPTLDTRIRAAQSLIALSLPAAKGDRK